MNTPMVLLDEYDALMKEYIDQARQNMDLYLRIETKRAQIRKVFAVTMEGSLAGALGGETTWEEVPDEPTGQPE